ncbi:tail tubular protein A [Synechococcus T7-like virus S-TIP28]|uniref:Tail tubular protein A n=1 Tax=Synechococcus T7-like virus S-TIP28 TaxID=1332140 RepID=A0AAE9BPX9_9CAUD|nr:tail tubular protein A [Synechococcus T7-like virus S-TIP28]
MATKLNKLAAVNILLSNIGQAPVTAIDNANPMVAMAANLIDEVTNNLQAEGWTFNTEQAYPFQPAADGCIYITDNILQLDAGYYSTNDTVQRNGKLYNKRTHSYQFEGKQEFDVVWLVEFDDMPDAFKNYVSMRAANLFAGRSVGSAEAVKFGEREEMMARAAMLEYETQQGDYNMLGTADNMNSPQTYRPNSVLTRY